MSINVSFDCYAVSDRGCCRSLNEDTYICNPEKGLFLVADGMGGENCGEVASRLTADYFENFITPFIIDEDATIPFEQPLDADPFFTAMLHAIEQTNQSVLQFVEDNPSHRGMGSTLTAAVVHGESLYVAHVGDSRFYCFQNGQPVQITQDHTRVQELVKKNLLSAEEARNHRQRHILTQCVGRKKKFKPDIICIETDPETLYMICSDGLFDMLSDDEIGETVMQSEDLEFTGKQLVTLANDRGGKDNITAVLFRQCQENSSQESPDNGHED